LREYAQRSVQAIKEIKKGETLSEGKNIDILRPGKQKQGLHPKHMTEIEGKKAIRNISLGDGIQENDYE
jgi:N-acetylneuraminate synthase